MQKNVSRLSDCFQARRDARKKVLITYVMAGYPNKAGTVNMIDGMIEGGADIVEIGFPFSDPLADGKLIQKASTIALGHKMNLDAYFKIVSSVRKAHPKTPLLMMTYANIREYTYDFTILKYASRFILCPSAIVDAFCISLPSASGSENGNPISTMSAPPSIIPSIIFTVPALFGYPAITYVIKTFFLASRLA